MLLAKADSELHEAGLKKLAIDISNVKGLGAGNSLMSFPPCMRG